MLAVYRKITTKYHTLLHILIGLIIGVYFSRIVTPTDSVLVILVSTISSLVPDIEHLVFFWSYGRKTAYAMKVNGYLRKKQIREAISFLSINHKNLHSLYLHNILTPFVFMLFFIFFFSTGKYILSAAFLSFSCHYIYDIFEDLMLLGKINSNWLFKFDKVKNN